MREHTSFNSADGGVLILSVVGRLGRGKKWWAWWWGDPHLSHDGGGEGAVVVDPAIHAQLRVGLAPVGGRGVGVQELPLWVVEAETLVGPTVGARRNGDRQEGLGAEVGRGPGAIVQQVSPAAMAWDSG